MRTKALILSAMLGIAGVCSSVAQNVYSVNVVGYTTLSLSNSFNLIANQLDNGAGNLVTNMLTGLPANTIVYKYNPTTSAYTQLTWLGTLWTPPNNRTMNLLPGEGLFVKNPAPNPATSPITITFVGEVMQGTLVNPVTPGFDIYSAMVPQQGGLVSVHGYTPTANDIVYKYRGTAYAQKTFLVTGNWSPAGGLPAGEPILDVGEAVFIKSSSAATKNWTRTFTVN